MRAPKTSSSEFPNDNRELHEGAIFALRTTSGPAEPEYAIEATPDFGSAVQATLLEQEEEEDPNEELDVDVEAFPLVVEEPTVVDARVAFLEEGDELETIDLDAVESPAPSTEPEPEVEEPAPVATVSGVVPCAGTTPYDGWLRTIHKVATDAGSTIALDALQRLVFDGTVERSAMPDASDDALYDGKIATALGDNFIAFESFLDVASEWRNIINGDGGDLANCGGRTLDEWSADLISRLLGAPAKLDSIRRALRQHGVAAFGYVESAA
jgi:hypothetical protein